MKKIAFVIIVLNVFAATHLFAQSTDSSMFKFGLSAGYNRGQDLGNGFNFNLHFKVEPLNNPFAPFISLGFVNYTESFVGFSSGQGYGGYSYYIPGGTISRDFQIASLRVGTDLIIPLNNQIYPYLTFDIGSAILGVNTRQNFGIETSAGGGIRINNTSTNFSLEVKYRTIDANVGYNSIQINAMVVFPFSAFGNISTTPSTESKPTNNDF